MRPGARIASLILVAFSCLAPISSQAAHSAPGQATEPDWANLPYFRHDYGGWFRIWTNQNTFDNGVRIINGGDPGSMFNPYPGPTVEELDPLNDFQGLWSTKCQKVKEQTFKTSRKIYLPGDADLLQVSLGAYSYSSENKPSPVDSVEILVNGIGVHKVKATKANPIPFANSERTIEDVTDEAHLIFGLNTFTVIAHKKATKKAAGWCTGDNKFAVSAEVYGEFLADLEVTRELGIHHTDGFLLSSTVTNLGPSVLVPGIVGGAGGFGVQAVGAGVAFDKMLITPAAGCGDATEIGNYYGEGLSVACVLPEMAPGASVSYQIVGQYVSPVTDVQSGYGVQGSVGGLGYGETTTEELQNNSVPFAYPTQSP
jgi:hypothetical protein